MRRLLWMAMAAALSGAASATPPVGEIRFEGNHVTREEVFLREMALRPGDPADPGRIEESRQAIQDLGLFREVEIIALPAEGAVDLLVRVREKRYVLPLPRIDASSDEDYSYGAQLRWNNFLGRNHTLNLYAETGRYPNDRLREREDSARISYAAPYLLGQDSLAASLERIERVAPGVPDSFDERITRAQVLAVRDLRDSRPRRGWLVNAGVFVQQQSTQGESAPPADGRAIALVAGADYADVRFQLYSESGRRSGLRVESAVDGWGSDYGYRRVTAHHAELIALDRPHHNLNLIASAGWYSGGTRRRNAFSLGGSGTLRGYDADYLEGQRFGHASVEYLRPLGRNWLRLLLLAEAGGTGGSVDGARDGGPYANVGAGVRIRLPWFVNVEVEAGVAWPLRGGDGVRFFAGGN